MSKFSQHNTRSAKVTTEMVVNMRREYVEGASQSELSRKYGLSIGQVGRIVRGEAWQHIPAPARELSREELDAMFERLKNVRPEPVLDKLERAVVVERKDTKGMLDKFLDPDKARDYLGDKEEEK